MPDRCHSLASEVQQLIVKIPPLDIPIGIRELLKKELIGCERELGSAETNALIASLFPQQPPH
jgi:hypothetical protein